MYCGINEYILHVFHANTQLLDRSKVQYCKIYTIQLYTFSSVYNRLYIEYYVDSTGSCGKQIQLGCSIYRSCWIQLDPDGRVECKIQ